MDRDNLLTKYHIVYDKKYKYASFLLVLLLVFAVVLQLIYPKLIEQLLISIDWNLEIAYGISIAIITVCLLKALVSLLTDILSNYLFISLNILLKNRIIEKIFNLCFQESQLFNIGELTQTYCCDVDAVVSYVSNVIISLIINLLIICGVIVISIATNFYLGLILFMISIVTFFTLCKVNNYAAPFWAAQRESMEEFYTYIYGVFDLIKELKLSNNSSYITESFEDILIKISSSNFFAALMGYHLWVASIICFSVTKWVLVFIGGVLVYQNVLNVPTIFLFTYYLDMITAPIETLRVNLQAVQASDASLERIKAIFAIQNTMQYGEKEIRGELNIDFNNVSFSYKNSLVLDKFSMQLRENEIVSLVGKSGVGKTTIVKLICRLYDVQDGVIFINDNNIKEFTKESLSDNIEYISQIAAMEGLTVKEALRLDNINKINLFRRYLVLFDLDKYSIKINDNMGYLAATLSAGSYQTIYAIKTLISDKRILLLDEITSHMDTTKENLYYNELNYIKRNKIILFITHKDTLISKCDRVIEIKKDVENE